MIDKPTGITSFDVIRQLRKAGYPHKMGHAGTLDPLASGLLIVCSDADTKRISEYMGMEKIYQTTIDFSLDTDTRDTDARAWQTSYPVIGKNLDTGGGKVTAPSYDMIDDFLQSHHGTHDMPLTPFSAKKLKGKKLYEYAREGNPQHVLVPMTIKDHTILSYDFPLLRLELHVGTGTYIRSIAHYLGDHFGMGGIVTELRRTHIGIHSVDDTLPLAAAMKHKPQ